MNIRKIAAIAALSAMTAVPAFATVQGGNGPTFESEQVEQRVETRQVRAGDVLQQKDLVRRDLDADDLITLSEVPHGAPVDFSSANNG
ncbi:hypothetical protein Q4511_02180 [Paracoccus sp. 1_MG-2023]|uniref:hypothetical protein n=1 Tax=unclassified Paracoccus (in: a-proteobacteria) TaxID=2688777 RepID=UPI001C082810|nr:MULTISPECIES: hypothetical protein [unclassified Paracoccus (in: a-proteobacteria)]MBU2958726.1 hypothetical protein [Paracoccus sp. C2R09]MDO6667719.1 hypothetical protein [Paracoccus sp. 1_MG-2023]